MKTVIKVFEIISIVGKSIAAIFSLIYAFACFGASQTIIDQMISQGAAKDAEEAKIVVAALGIYLILIAVYSIFALTISIMTLVKLKNLTKRPIALGVLNILFCSLISGICLLVIDPTSTKAVSSGNEYDNYR